MKPRGDRESLWDEPLLGLMERSDGGLTVWSCIGMNVTGGAPSEGGRPATQEMCSVRTFPCHCGEMIYDLFSNKSQPDSCTGSPLANECQGPPHRNTLAPSSTAGTSSALLFLSKSNCSRTVKFSIFGHPYCMSANWNKRKDGGESTNPWMTELQWCWIEVQAWQALHTWASRQMVWVEGYITLG